MDRGKFAQLAQFTGTVSPLESLIRQQNLGVLRFLSELPDEDKTAHRASSARGNGGSTTQLPKSRFFQAGDDSDIKPIADIIDAVAAPAGGRGAIGGGARGTFLQVTDYQSSHTDAKSSCIRVVMSQPLAAALVDEKGAITKPAPTALSGRHMVQLHLNLSAELGDHGVWMNVNYRGKRKLMKITGSHV